MKTKKKMYLYRRVPVDCSYNTTGILSDKEITALCMGGTVEEDGMITPFSWSQQGKPSWGLGSYGYDIRLGNNFLLQNSGDAALDPNKDCSEYWTKYSVHSSDGISIGPGETILAESFERFDIPDDVMCVCLGKSSYARCGLLVNITPLEPGWKGTLTIELSNLNKERGIILHPGQGIAQVLFFRGCRPARTYIEKEAGGGYQDQEGVTLPT